MTSAVAAAAEATVVVRKMAFSEKRRFLFVAGLEGCGHHMIRAMAEACTPVKNAREMKKGRDLCLFDRSLALWHKERPHPKRAPDGERVTTSSVWPTVGLSGRRVREAASGTSRCPPDSPERSTRLVAPPKSVPERSTSKGRTARVRQVLESRAALVRRFREIESAEPALDALFFLNTFYSAEQSYPRGWGDDKALLHPDVATVAALARGGDSLKFTR